MSEKLAPPPLIAAETMLRLLAATADFAARKPWKFMADTDVVGLADPVTGEIRLGSVLGNAEEIFAASIYRRPSGLRWILSMLEAGDTPELEMLEGLDALKIEFVPKHELAKAELAALKAAGFRPNGKGHVWPQFRSMEPGWLPWYINQTEAEQMLADLPRLTAFSRLLERHPDLYGDRDMNVVPFLPNPMPGRPLELSDLEWRTLVVAPEPLIPFQPTARQLAQLRSLPGHPEAGWQYDCFPMPACPVLEAGRPCLTRFNLVVEDQRGLILGSEMFPGHLPLAESAGQGLVNILLKNGVLPGEIAIPAGRLEFILRPFCDALKIKLTPAASLPFLDEAIASLSDMMRGV
jgi:hypothetical protein